ncbi:hypothetical protein FAM09_12605 [Niastella caeni]|uniref:Polysaccharide lyase n=1 Tax=Niastella caeni TaxID=2569763 RepID=A0A4S8HVB2_9BACT|nr:polysaccharide lyase [Niastella caeni]THU39345.1 hypothetical protein FAM09_12605 [Niastella caeni]
MITQKKIILASVLLSGTMVYSHKENFSGNANLLAQTKLAHILYHVNFEENNSFPSFLKIQTATPYGLQTVETPVYEGKKAARFELRDSDPENSNGTRAEIAFPGTDNTIKPERWYAFAVFFPTNNFEPDTSDEVICQWHQGGKATPSLCFRTKADRIKLRIVPRANSKKWIDLGAIERNVWQYYVVHVKHSSQEDGLVEIWRDGKKLVTRSGANMYELNSGIYHTPKFKLGIYKADWNGSTVTKASKRVLYFDAIKIGDEHAEYADMTGHVE